MRYNSYSTLGLPNLFKFSKDMNELFKDLPGAEMIEVGDVPDSGKGDYLYIALEKVYNNIKLLKESYHAK